MSEHNGNYSIGTGKMLKKEKATSLVHLLLTCLDSQYYTTAPQIGCAQYVLCLLPIEKYLVKFQNLQIVVSNK